VNLIRALFLALALPGTAGAAGWTALCASLYVMPANAPVGATLTVYAAVFDCGGARTNNVAPCMGMMVPPSPVSGCSTMKAIGTAPVYLLSGPVPDSATNIDIGKRAEYTWTYLAPNRGAVQFSVTFTGFIVSPPPVGTTRCSDTGDVVIRDAELAATVYTVPPVWSVGQSGLVIARVRNTGLARADGVAPAPLVVATAGGASLVPAGPPPTGPVTLVPGAEAFFTWAYTAASAGSVIFTATITGTGQDPAGNSLLADNSVPAVLATPALLSSMLTVSPSGTVGYNKEFIIFLILTDEGEADADVVKPYLPTIVGTGLLEQIPCNMNGKACPITVDLDAAWQIRIGGGASRTFMWKYRAVREGTVTFSVSSEGEDYNSRIKVASPLESVSLNLVVPSVFSVTITGAEFTKVIQGQEIKVTLNVEAVSATGTVLSGFTAYLDGKPSFVRVVSVEPGLPRSFAEGVMLRTFTLTLRMDASTPVGGHSLVIVASGYEDRLNGSVCVSVCDPFLLFVFSGDSGFFPRSTWCDHNPFRPRFDRKATMMFTVSQKDAGRRFAVKVYSLSGELVRVVLDEALPAGVASASWDGLNRGKQGVASGLYMAVLSGPGGTETRKLAVIK